MKTLVLASFLIGLLVLPLTPSWGAEQTFHFKIKGMVCPVCPVAISKSIRKLQGVKDVSVSLKKGAAIVVADDSLRPEEIIAQVQMTGHRMGGKYTATLVTE